MEKGGNLKTTKKGWKYGAGAGVHMCVCVCVEGGGVRGEGGCNLTYLVFHQGLSILCLEITLPFAKLCYAFEKIFFFSATITLCKKVTRVCLKMNLLISHKLRYPICKGVYNIKN